MTIEAPGRCAEGRGRRVEPVVAVDSGVRRGGSAVYMKAASHTEQKLGATVDAPLIKGGQGRAADDIAKSGAIGGVLLCAVVMLFLGVIVAGMFSTVWAGVRP